MKLHNAVSQTLKMTVFVVGAIALTAIALKYPGFIELQCNTQGCRIVIDGRELVNSIHE